MQRDFLRLEAVELPPGVQERPLDHRVPLKRRQRIVEPFNGNACRAPRRGDAKLVLAILASERQLADDRFLAFAAKNPPEHTDVMILMSAAFDPDALCVVSRDCQRMRHA